MVAPLEGIKVLEVASWLAAPSCAALMADMGAEVIKVEPPSGDTYRNLYTPRCWERTLFILAFNSITVASRAFASILKMKQVGRLFAR